MRRSKVWTLLLVLFAALAVSACAPHKIYRTDYSLCVSDDPETECASHALQANRDTANPDKDYVLALIEFDDQGQLFDRRQMRAVLDHLFELASPEDQDLLMVVFVHGWKHSAAPGDDNIATFRRALEHLSATETRIGQRSKRKPRKVVGVYLGWRGGSITLPLVKELTFWDRKNTAHKVGRGGVTEVLNRIELVRQTKESVSDTDGLGTRLVVVGHSFGGAVVFSALSQILENGFIHTVGPEGQISNPRGFGDLVVLINPAFEAERYAPLSDMSTERGTYFQTQLPVLAVLTSEADDATGRAFPAGRWFSTLFEKTREMQRDNGVSGETETIKQHDANITAVGHFDPYITHSLRAKEVQQPNAATQLSVERSTDFFYRISQSWEDDAPGSRIEFPSSELIRTQTSAGRNPYLNVRVDGELIKDHNDIDDPRIIEFVTQLILISGQSEDPAERSMMRSRGLGK
ncbi:MAG: esterase [Sedimenticolaceae bacterium]